MSAPGRQLDIHPRLEGKLRLWTMVTLTVLSGAAAPAVLLVTRHDAGTALRLWLVLTAVAIPFAEIASWRLMAMVTQLVRFRHQLSAASDVAPSDRFSPVQPLHADG